MRIGISSYLNTQILSYALQEKRIEYDFEIVCELPHVCAQLLRDKKLDAALIPSIEYARAKDDYQIFDSFSIASNEYVKSVELFLKSDLEQIKTVALDKSSRTSVILTKIILEEKFEIEADYIEMDANLDLMLEKADAALIIGDQALYYHDTHPKRLDLAEEWYTHTGLPFVFAFIASYENVIDASVKQSLDAAFQYGMNHLDEICKNWALQNPQFPASYYKTYLSENISYDFSDRHKEALNIFYDYAFLRNEIDYFPEFKYHSAKIDENE